MAIIPFILLAEFVLDQETIYDAAGSVTSPVRLSSLPPVSRLLAWCGCKSALKEDLDSSRKSSVSKWSLFSEYDLTLARF